MHKLKRDPRVLAKLGGLKTHQLDGRGVGRPIYRIVKNRATVELEKFHPIERGYHQARCPICAEHGLDEDGQTLLLHPDGGFTCWMRPAVHGDLELKIVMSKVQKPTQMEVAN